MVSFALLGVLLLVPSDLWAWGPIAHLDYAQEALRHTASFLPQIRELLTRHPNDFLYGALAADITVGKAYVDYIYNCHNWRVGFLILNEARDDRQRACAYGYLSHLAVDIIAHNFFVPYKTIRCYPTRTLGHVYWEMRFDARRPHSIWKEIGRLAKMDFRHDDDLFERMLRRTLFSFKTNKRIFNSVMTLHKFRHWKTMFQGLTNVSRWRLEERDIEEYRALAIESCLTFLKNPEKAPCVKVDPTGADKLLYAQEMRRELKRVTRKGFLSEAGANDFLKGSKKALRETIYHPRSLPTVAEWL